MPFGFVSIDSIVQQMRLFAVWCFLSIRACGILLLSCNFSGQRQSVYRYQRRWKFLKLWLLFAIVIIVTATILVLFLSGKFLSVGPWKVEMKRNVTYELATVDGKRKSFFIGKFSVVFVFVQFLSIYWSIQMKTNKAVLKCSRKSSQIYDGRMLLIKNWSKHLLGYWVHQTSILHIWMLMLKMRIIFYSMENTV